MNTAAKIQKVSTNIPSTSVAGTSVNEKPILETPSTEGDTIDLFKIYPTLQLRRTYILDTRPLSHLSFVRNDPYISIFRHFTFLYFRLGRQIIDDVNTEDWKTSNAEGGDRWLNFETVQKHSPKLTDFFVKITKERKEATKFDFTTLGSFQVSNEKLISEMKLALPSRPVIQGYLEFFFEIMWCHVPIVDQDDFTSEISRVICFDPETDLPELKLSKRSDLSLVTLLLIILRYSSVSLSLISKEKLEKKYSQLQADQIPSSSINIAETYIRLSSINNSPSMTTLQSLILLRFYLRDCPERNDAPDQLQMQLMSSYVMQCVTSLGFTRDPDQIEQFRNDIDIKNLRRRIWNVLETIEAESEMLNGAISVNPDPCFINVKPEENPSRSQNNIIQEVLQTEWLNNQKMNKVYMSISKLFNRVDLPVKISDIEDILSEQANLIDTIYQLKPLPPKQYSLKGLSEDYKSAVFKNTRYLEKKIIQLAVEVQVYHILTCHYEAIPFANKNKYFYFMKKSLVSIKEMMDLSLSYLTGRLEGFIPQSSRFCILPLINRTLIRAANVYSSYIIHLYHAEEIIKRGKIPVTQENLQKIEKLTDLIINQTSYIMNMIHDELSTRYWFSLKIGMASKHIILMLKQYKFTSVSGVLRIFHGDDDGISQIGEVDKEATRRLRDKLIQRENVKNVMESWEYTQVKKGVGERVPLSKVYVNPFVNISIEETTELLDIVKAEMTHFRDFHNICERDMSEETRVNNSSSEDHSDKFSFREESTTISSNVPSGTSISTTPTLDHVCNPDTLGLGKPRAIINENNQGHNFKRATTAHETVDNNSLDEDPYSLEQQQQLNFDFTFFDEFNDGNDQLFDKIFQGFVI